MAVRAVNSEGEDLDRVLGDDVEVTARVDDEVPRTRAAREHDGVVEDQPTPPQLPDPDRVVAEVGRRDPAVGQEGGGMCAGRPGRQRLADGGLQGEERQGVLTGVRGFGGERGG